MGSFNTNCEKNDAYVSVTKMSQQKKPRCKKESNPSPHWSAMCVFCQVRRSERGGSCPRRVEVRRWNRGHQWPRSVRADPRVGGPSTEEQHRHFGPDHNVLAGQSALNVTLQTNACRLVVNEAFTIASFYGLLLRLVSVPRV